MADSELTLIIHDGGLPGLVAAMLAPESASVVAWIPPSGSRLRAHDLDDAQVVDAVARQGERLGWRETLLAGEPRRTPGSPLSLSHDLLSAVAIAASRGCSTVVWPVVCGADLDALYEVAERAQAITRLAWLDLPGGPEDGPGSVPAIVIQTPFADLTAAQLAEMAEDLGAPVSLCPDGAIEAMAR